MIRDVVIGIARHWRTWIDKDGLSLGQDFNEEIQRHIVNAGSFVAFISVHYCDSDYCLRELECAVSHGRVIVPVRMDAEGDLRQCRHGKGVLSLLVSALPLVLPDAFSHVVLERLVGAGVVDVAKEDCVGDHPELFFPSYIPPFAVSLPTSFRFACDYRPDVLKLIGREEKLLRLEGFANDEALNLWCLVAGAAGTGKSRLCHAFATRMNRLSWDVRYLDHDIEMGLEKLRVRACNDMLVIVDYAIVHASDIVAFLHYLHARRNRRFKTRVIPVDGFYGWLVDEDAGLVDEIGKMQYGCLPFYLSGSFG